MDWAYHEFGTPTALSEIDPEMYEEERAKMAARIHNAGTEIVLAMRQEAVETMGNLVERLTDAPDGKKKSFHKSTVKNLTDFINYFDVRNDICGDDQLKALISQVKNVIQGEKPNTFVTAEELRTNDGLRSSIRDKLSDFQSKIDSLITNKASRKITFSATEIAAANTDTNVVS